jgi:hypothetical protein
MTEYAEIDYSKLVCPLSMMSGNPVLCITDGCGAWLQKARKHGGEVKVCFVISFFNAGSNALRLFGMKLNDEFYRGKDTRNRSTSNPSRAFGETDEKEPTSI